MAILNITSELLFLGLLLEDEDAEMSTSESEASISCEESSDPDDDMALATLRGTVSAMPPPSRFSSASKLDIAVGTWVAVRACETWYPGVVVGLSNDEFEVNFLEPTSQAAFNSWQWPSVPDKLKICLPDILCKLTDPQPASTRRTNILKLLADEVTLADALLAGVDMDID